MNKTELVAAVAEDAGISKKDAERAVNAFMNAVMDEVKGGGKVQLIGFGTFESVRRAERQGRNPQNGEAITVPAAVVPKFKPGKAFKDALN